MRQFRRLGIALAAMIVMLMSGVNAYASNVDEAVVDATSPTGSVSLTAGASAPITIKLTVTGKQTGTATFQVNQDWTLAGGTFVGSNPRTFTVAPQLGGTVTTFTATGTITVDPAQAAGVFTLTAGALNITNTNDTQAKLSAGSASSYSVVVIAGPKPVLTLPSAMAVEATGPSGALVSYSATAADAGGNSLPVSCTPAPGTVFALGTTTVACSATDSLGATGSGSFTVTVDDTTAPTLSLPAAITAEASGATGAVVDFTATSTDLVDGSDAVVCTPASHSTFPLGKTTVTCSASDAHDNSASGAFTVTVQDTTAPTLQLTDVAAEATGPSGATVTFTASATDAVDGTDPATCDAVSGSTFEIGDTTVTCSSTDAHGNTGTGRFTVTVSDTTAPVLVLPSGLQPIEATGPSGAQVEYAATASDVVDGSVDAACVPDSGSIFPVGTTTVRCSAGDAHGNEASGSFDVTVVDTTPPQLSLPADIKAEAAGPDGAAVDFQASATDLVDGTVPVNCSADPGDTFALGDTTVTCTAADAHGNVGRGSFTVTVRDTTPPTLHLPANVTVEATGPDGATVDFDATATDLVDGTDPVDCTAASGSTFGLGDTTVDCTATDVHGNHGQGSFTVTVQDTTPPDLTLPGDTTIEATGPSGARVSFETSASDLVDGSVAVTCDPASGSTFALGDTTVTCSASDQHQNVASGVFTVTVQDTTPPDLSLPKDITSEATGPTGAAVSFTATASDLVDGSDAVTCDPASGSTFALDVTTAVDCSATDAHGNTGRGSFTVRVVDTTAPTVTVPKDLTVDPTGPTGASVSFSATATDLVDGSDAVICDPASGSSFAANRTTRVTCSATDAHGNTGTGTFNVTVNPLTLKGFYSPVAMTTAVWNTVKAGATVPLKFQVFAGATQITDVSVVKSFVVSKASCQSGATTDPVDFTTTGGSSLRYDSSAVQFVQNWQTPKTSGACYTVTMTTVDGSHLSANVSLK